MRTLLNLSKVRQLRKKLRTEKDPTSRSDNVSNFDPGLNSVCPYSLYIAARRREEDDRKIEAPSRQCHEKRYATSVSSSATSSAKIQEPPEPQGLPFFGTVLELFLCGGPKKLYEYIDKKHKELGPVFREQIGPVKGIFVNSPQEYLRIFRLEGSTPKHFLPETWLLYNELRASRRGLLFMDGEEWLHFRRILNKIMLVPDQNELLCAPCHQAARRLTEQWKSYARNGSEVSSLESELYQWSIEVMLATLMGTAWDRHKDEMSHNSKYLANTLHKIFEYTAKLSMVPAKFAMRLRLPAWNRFVKSADSALQTVRMLVLEMIRLRSDGLLKVMMDEGIREEDVVRIVTDFIIAAGDTTAFSMQWMLLLLSGHPEIQEKLYERTSNLSPREVLRDSLIKGVIKETLRLYPIAPLITRYLPQDSVIGGYFVPKETLVLLSIYSSSHDPTNFLRPDEFYPERWIRTENGNYRDVIHPHASLPFALGARSCIGRKLAETQMALALAELVRKYRIECVNGDQVRMILHLISVPSIPIKLKLLERRNVDEG